MVKLTRFERRVLNTGILERVPYFMRSWPLLRRYYWQTEELEEIRIRAEERARQLGIGQRPEQP